MPRKYLITTALLLILGAVAYFYLNNRTYKEKVKPDLQNFTLSNPEEIDRIFMVRKGGNQLTLTLKDSIWYVNDNTKAYTDKVHMLLFETAAKLAVAGPVPKTARHNVIAKMAATGTKVEFWKGKELVKTYYVGGTTPDQLGTHMWMEGAKDPYVIKIPGFDGYLNSRYTTVEADWFSKELFHVTNSQIASAGVDYPAHPEWSFNFVKRQDKVDITIDGINEGKPVNASALLGYFGQFTSISCEGFPENISQQKIDSIRKAIPYCTVTVKTTNGKTHQLKVYQKEAHSNMYELYDKKGNQLVYDPERYYAFFDNDPRLMYIQELVFKNILLKYSDFLLTQAK